MNKKVIFIFIFTLIALAFLAFYSFGPSSSTQVGPKVNPASFKPTTAQTTLGHKDVALSVYHNKDLAENFYSIAVPQAWQRQTAAQAGSYTFTFDGGTAAVQLMDVPDNSTLELYVLSQEEPKLKSSTPGYKRIDYKKVTVNGDDAYQLAYASAVNGVLYQTVRTYITGQDHAGLITLAAKQSDAASLADLFASTIYSFRWENK